MIRARYFLARALNSAKKDEFKQKELSYRRETIDLIKSKMTDAVSTVKLINTLRLESQDIVYLCFGNRGVFELNTCIDVLKTHCDILKQMIMHMAKEGRSNIAAGHQSVLKKCYEQLSTLTREAGNHEESVYYLNLSKGINIE